MKLYLDMDGVIADFFGGLEKKYNTKHWKQIPKLEESIIALQGTDFFNTLELYPSSMELVKFVQNLVGDDWGICSSPLRGDRDNSAYWKRVWLQRHGWMPEVENCIFTSNKHKYAINRLTGEPNILVDDKQDNIIRWRTAGGIGIRYQADEDDVFDLIDEIQGAIDGVS